MPTQEKWYDGPFHGGPTTTTHRSMKQSPLPKAWRASEWARLKFSGGGRSSSSSRDWREEER